MPLERFALDKRNVIRVRRVPLSRATTVSSRMRDAYIDQETFRGRYIRMLAQYSSMQSLVYDLKRELSIRSNSQASTHASAESETLVDCQRTIRELQQKLILAEKRQRQAPGLLPAFPH